MKLDKCNVHATMKLQVTESLRMNTIYNYMLYLQYDNKYNFTCYYNLYPMHARVSRSINGAVLWPVGGWRGAGLIQLDAFSVLDSSLSFLICTAVVASDALLSLFARQ